MVSPFFFMHFWLVWLLFPLIPQDYTTGLAGQRWYFSEISMTGFEPELIIFETVCAV